MVVSARKSIITPTCLKCGRMRRDYAWINRRSLGFWGPMRLCCCDEFPVLPDDCGCCEENTTPTKYLATVTGLNPCTCFTSIADPFLDFRIDFLKDLNRVWTLESVGLGCVYQEILTDAVRFRRFSSTDLSCSGSVTIDNTYDVVAELRWSSSLSGSDTLHHITFRIGVYEPTLVFSQFFFDTQEEICSTRVVFPNIVCTGCFDCREHVFNFVNQRTNCNVATPPPVTYATGGAATLVPSP